ncbi:MAG: ABC transporter ATP-binding protein [Actinomycetota bacterium]
MDTLSGSERLAGPSSPQRTKAVEVLDLKKVYASRKSGPITAVDGVSFSVDKGEIVGLLGPNGAGKTTTIKSMCTLIKPTSGSIKIEGIDAVRSPSKAVENVAAVLEGNRNIYWRLTPIENLEFFAGLAGIPSRRARPAAQQLLERFGLTEKTKDEARKLSRGMQQKLAVACAFIKSTPVLLLDEPTLGLDVETSHELRKSLVKMAAEDGRTILLSSHDMDVVQQMCERVLIIDKGRIVTDDKVSNLLQLFRVKAYRFALSSPFGDAQRSSVTEQFPHAIIETEQDITTIQVALKDAGEIYALVEILRKYDAVIDSIDRADPDLEEIFLRIVKGESL